LPEWLRRRSILLFTIAGGAGPVEPFNRSGVGALHRYVHRIAMPKRPIPPSEQHRTEQIPPRGPAVHPDPDPDSLGQEGDQSNIKNTTDGGRRQDRI
jgi:hypothetical protein